MKKSVIFVFLFLVLGASMLVSAFSFSDLFNPTGKVAWEITEPTGICLPIDSSTITYEQTQLNYYYNTITNEIVPLQLSVGNTLVASTDGIVHWVGLISADSTTATVNVDGIRDVINVGETKTINGLALTLQYTNRAQTGTVQSGIIIPTPKEVICMQYNSKSTCDADTNCEWLSCRSTYVNDEGVRLPCDPADYSYYREFMDNPIHINQGWNLIYGLIYPGQISSGDITPNNIKSIYGFNPLSKTYFNYFDSTNPGESSLPPDLSSLLTGSPTISSSPFVLASNQGNGLHYDLVWVYSDKIGDIKFRMVRPDITFVSIPLSSGWNFVDIFPGLFYDNNNVKQNSFTLSSIAGNCNINKAYFFGAGTNPLDTSSLNQWVQIGLNDVIPNTNMYRVMAINVPADCNLARFNPNKICTITSSNGNLNNLIDYYTKRTVTLKDGQGNIIDSQTDSCGDPVIGFVNKYWCRHFSNSNDVVIYPLRPGTGQGNCITCEDGKCTKLDLTPPV